MWSHLRTGAGVQKPFATAVVYQAPRGITYTTQIQNMSFGEFLDNTAEAGPLSNRYLNPAKAATAAALRE